MVTGEEMGRHKAVRVKVQLQLVSDGWYDKGSAA